jgi:hypothetical protein
MVCWWLGSAERYAMRRVFFRAFVAVVTVAWPALTWAQAPAITSHSGALTHGSSVTLTVTNAATKSRSTQVLWDTMNGSNGSTDLEGRNPDGPGAWLVYGGSAPEPRLSNAVTRDTPSRTTSVFMRESGSSVPGFCVGTNGTGYLTLTAASAGNTFAFADNVRITLDFWMHYTKPTSTSNLKLSRQHSLNNPSTGAGNRGFLWFVGGNDSAEAIVHGGMNTAFTLGDLDDGSWHHVQYLQRWSDTKADMEVYFRVDNVLYADTNPPGEYDSPQGGFSEGSWLLLPAGDRMGTLCLESQGHSGGGSHDESYYAADIYVDEGYNRVVLSNHETCTSATHQETQPYTAWPNDDGNVTITLNRGTFAANTQAWLHLYDANDVCSAGYPVMLSGVATLTAPTNLRVLPPDIAGLLWLSVVVPGVLSARKRRQ